MHDLEQEVRQLEAMVTRAHSQSEREFAAAGLPALAGPFDRIRGHYQRLAASFQAGEFYRWAFSVVVFFGLSVYDELSQVWIIQAKHCG